MLRILRGSPLSLSSNQELQNGPNQRSLALFVMELSHISTEMVQEMAFAYSLLFYKPQTNWCQKHQKHVMLSEQNDTHSLLNPIFGVL